MSKEYIERNELIENLNRFAPEHYSALINMLITKQPAADVVEIPCRCRDCKHRRETMHGSYCLPAFGLKRITDLDAFCSYGERRTDNEL